IVELVICMTPDVRIGVAAEIALAVEQHRRNSAQQQLLDETERQCCLARAGAAEHGGVPLEHVAVEGHRLAATDLAPSVDALSVSAVLVEDYRERQHVVVGR